MASNKALCFTCNKQKPTYSCGGCANNFCFPHLQEHRQVLSGQLDEIINEHDQFKQTIIEQQQNPPNSSLLKQIDQWERTSMETIQKTAQQCREAVLGQTRRVVDEVEKKLGQFTAQLKHVREENEFNEIDLQRLTETLTEMTQELSQPSIISIQQDSQTLINKVQVTVLTPSKREGQISMKSSEKVRKRERALLNIHFLREQ